jgi:glycine dehydrogenase
VFACFGGGAEQLDLRCLEAPAYPEGLARKTEFMTHPIFERYHSETELLRYIHRLQNQGPQPAHA